jgi:DeoR/GlpR family transcriptional regulator of sugar metabolism
LKLERQAKIVSQIVQDRMVSVTKLSELFKVSEITIRRDLDELTRIGKIQRVHGGGELIETNEPEPPILQRQVEQLNEKDAIARLANKYFKDGDTV